MTPSQIKAVLALVAAALLVIALLVVPGCIRDLKTAKKEAEVAQGQAGAAIDAGAEASNTLGNVMDRARETDATVKEGIDAIRKAPEAERGDRTVDAACRLRAYRDTERCASVRAPGSARPAGAHPAR